MRMGYRQSEKLLIQTSLNEISGSDPVSQVHTGCLTSEKLFISGGGKLSDGDTAN